MNITLRKPADDAMLDLAIAECRDKKQGDRLRAVRYALDGCETQEIVETLGRSRSFVQDWCYAYRDGGLEAIKVSKPTGRPPKLEPEQQDAFKQRILNGPTDADGGLCTLRGIDAKRILAEEFDTHFDSLSGVYVLLHRLGLSCLRPRPQHTKNDPDAMEQWLKDAPLLSRASATSTPSVTSRSGSRTKSGSASRAR